MVVAHWHFEVDEEAGLGLLEGGCGAGFTEALMATPEEVTVDWKSLGTRSDLQGRGDSSIVTGKTVLQADGKVFNHP